MRIPGTASAAFLSSAALVLSAQTTMGELKGRVRLAGTIEAPAQVILALRNAGTGETRTLRANERGDYGFRMVTAGSYLLEVEAQGCSPRRLTDIQILLGTVSVLDVELYKASEGLVEVVADAPGADPQRTQVATIIPPGSLEGLPINRRSFADFSLTIPGVARSNTPVSGGVPSSGLSFRGMNPRQNRFLVDGLDNNYLGNGSVGCPIGQEAVKEFQVITGAPSAEFGRASGGVVNSILKGGTNVTSGSAFLFLRPGQWDAKSGEGVAHDDFRQEQSGVSLGGPLIQDRLFYFASAEHYRKRDVKEVSIDPILVLPQIQNGSHAFEETLTTGLVKLDYLPDDRNRWGIRLSLGQGHNEDQLPWGGLVARTAGGTLDSRNSTLALSHQWLGGIDWTNECRIQYARQASSLESMDPDRTASVTIAGIATFGTQRLTPQDARTEYFQFADTVTFFREQHTLKAGIDLLHSRNRATVEQNTAGAYVFQALPAPIGWDALTAFAVGVPVAYVQSWGNPSTRFRAESDALFLQDDWQITPRLLVKLGLRYDREVLPVFDDSVYSALHAPDPTRLPDGAIAHSQLFATQPDWSSSRLSPRFSFSWQAKEPLRLYGGHGVQSGSTQLGALFGPRLYNDRDVRTCFWTLLDPLGLFQVPGAWQQPDHRYGAPPPGYLPLIVIPGSYRMPKTTTWNLGLEWVPSQEHRLTLDLLHSRTRGLMNVRDVNAYVLTADGPRRPDLRYSQVLRIDGTGESHSWGQTLAWQWQARETFTLNLSYTHSKAEDNYTDWTPDYPHQNTYYPGQEWGPSSEDQTHQVLLSGIYHSSSKHPLLRDSSIAVIAQYASGRPYSKLVGYDQDFNGDGSADRPVGVGRNTERGPAIKTVDLRLAREFTTRKARLEFLLEIFNVFNTVNVLKVQNVLNASAFHPYGTPLEYGSMRQYQFGVKARF